MASTVPGRGPPDAAGDGSAIADMESKDAVKKADDKRASCFMNHSSFELPECCRFPIFDQPHNAADIPEPQEAPVQFDLEPQPLGQYKKVHMPSQNKYHGREAGRTGQKAEDHPVNFRIHLACSFYGMVKGRSCYGLP